MPPVFWLKLASPERIKHQIRKGHGGDKRKDKISLGLKGTMDQFSRHPKSGKMVLDS